MTSCCINIIGWATLGYEDAAFIESPHSLHQGVSIQINADKPNTLLVIMLRPK